MSESSPAGNALIASRKGDPRTIPISPDDVGKIPEKIRRQLRENYKSGGINIYGSAAESLHYSERDEHFMFSISMKDVFRHLPEEVWQSFNFPRTDEFPAGILQTN
ncbi:hypothetical protein KW799_01600 [Candidatus Parcubacteria bacterium]|nr:hypothetical protein [Candidatus Parcubacteria bacterium]